MVVASSSGRFQSIARLRSRIGTEPSTTTEPSGWARTPATTTSCSSAICATLSPRPHPVVPGRDIADDFLQDVFQRPHALDLAVLVDDEGEVRLAAAERLE